MSRLNIAATHGKPKLDGSSFLLPGGPTGILLLHGFTATTVEMRYLAEELHRRGYTVSAPCCPATARRRTC